MIYRSAFGYQLPSGHIKSVYCHNCDGPEVDLRVLRKYYNSLEKAEALIEPGNMSYLRIGYGWDENGSPDVKRRHQPLYYHERGDDDVQPIVTKSIEEAFEVWNDKWCEYLYVFVPDVGWKFHDVEGKFRGADTDLCT